MLDPEDSQERRWESLLDDLARVDRIVGKVPDAKPGPPATARAGPAYEHVRFQPQGENPALAPGVEFARLAPSHKLEALRPSHFPDLPEVEEGTWIAERDTHREAILRPGENLILRMAPGREKWWAKRRGKVLVIGAELHVLPSDRDARASVRVSSDNMEAFLDLEPGYGHGRQADRSLVEEALRQAGVRHGMLAQAIRDALEAASEGRAIAGMRVAQGENPRPGTPGKAEYLFEVATGPANLKEDDEGKIDFRSVKWVPAVEAGQLLARLIPPVPGQDGRNVLGEAMPVKTPPAPALAPGRNVRGEKDGTEFYAEIHGCVQLNGSRLDVLDVYVVNSDVDYRSGNVRFQGNVLVTGSIRRGFEVEADGDVVVLKNTEPCRIKAGRDVLVKGGVLGCGKGEFRVEAGRHIAAGYCENAWLEARGDIQVENYALQSFLYSCGAIRLDRHRGSLIGGETMALKGVSAKSIGSTAGIRTQVAAGINFAVQRKLETLATQKAELLKSMEKVDVFLKSLAETTRAAPLPPAKAAALKTVLEKRAQMGRTFESLTAQAADLEELQQEREKVFIRVADNTHPETVLAIQGKVVKIRQALYRAAFYLDPQKGEIMKRNW